MMSLLISTAAALLSHSLLGQVNPLPSPKPELSAFPQTAPLLSSLRWAYTLGRAEGEPGLGRSGLVQVVINGADGALPPGTTKIDGALMRAAYGLKAWGEELKQTSWIQAADKMALLIAASNILDGQKAEVPKGVQVGAPDLLQGAGYAALYAAQFPSSPASLELKKQTEIWIKERLDGRAPLSYNELGSLTLASQLWPENSEERAKLAEKLVPTGARLAGAAKTLNDQLATAQALLDGRHLLDRTNQRSLDQIIDSLLSPALALQLSENDARTAPIPTKGFIGLAGDRMPLEAWHVGTFMQAGANQPTPDLFQKGVLMLRGLMGLLSQPTGTENGLWQDDLFTGRLAPTPWMLAREGAKSWPGFALAEGQFMTSLYHINQRHGSIYHSGFGWREPVEALLLTKSGPISLLRQLPIPYSGVFRLVEVQGANRAPLASPPAAPLAVRPLFAAVDSSGLKVVAAPAFVQTPNHPLHPSGEFTVPSGQKKKAELGEIGFELRVKPSELQGGEYRFDGKAGGASFSSKSRLNVSAPKAAGDWTLMGGAAWAGAEAVEGVAGTGSQTLKRPRGMAVSRPFLSGRISLEYTTGPDCSVRIEDAQTNEILRTLRSGAPRTKTQLDYSTGGMRLLRIRLVDQSEKGFAAIYAVSVR